MSSDDLFLLQWARASYDLMCAEMTLQFVVDPVGRVEAIIRYCDQIIRHLDAVEHWREEEYVAHTASRFVQS